MNGPRVVQIIGGDDVGGAMSYLLPMLTALRAQGCDAHLLCLGEGGLARAAARRGLPHVILPMANPFDPRVLPALRRHITGGGWDLVHTHGMRANMSVRLVFATLTSRPLLFSTTHSDLELDYSNPVQAKAYAAANRLSRVVVDGFCCVSEDLARRLAEKGVPESRIYVVNPGIELPPQAATRVVPSALDPRSPGSGTIGTVARLVEVKDLELFLDATARLRERLPQVRAILVGDGPERHQLEHRAAAGNLGGHVEFMGHVRRVWAALARLDVFVLTSESEGVPISILEAMAMGLPVVATAVGGVPEAVEDNVTGFLVERRSDRAETAAAISARIAELLLDPELRGRMGEAAKARVARRFSSAVVGQKMLSIYTRELSAPSGRSHASRREP